MDVISDAISPPGSAAPSCRFDRLSHLPADRDRAQRGFISVMLYRFFLAGSVLMPFYPRLYSLICTTLYSLVQQRGGNRNAEKWKKPL